MTHKKLLVFILTYNAEKHIASVLDRIPAALWNNEQFESEVVIVDDASPDNTVMVARQHANATGKQVKILRNPINQGYGGNQKIGYTYAIQNGFDAVAMLHGDGQYAPEMVAELAAPILNGDADVVFGSRMLNRKDALKGGMPYYKFVGNIVLTKLQNNMLGSDLAEFHTGYRIYSTEALQKIPFQHNANDFSFDTDIIIQLLDQKMRIREIPIPTHYGDEVCHVNGVGYAWDILCSTLLSRVQKYGIFYHPKFDYGEDVHPYQDKTYFASSHSFALDKVGDGQSVLDIGAGGGHVARKLKARGCRITGCDQYVPAEARIDFDEILDVDLENIDFSTLPARNYDTILLLDVIEHLKPEGFMEKLHAYTVTDAPAIVLTTPNIAFIIQRITHLLGMFNYGKRGILDMTHHRLFTFSTIRQLVENAGFYVLETKGIPAPIPIALGDNWLARKLLAFNIFLISISKRLFSYQIAMVLRPRPTIESILKASIALGAEMTHETAPQTIRS